MIRKTRLGGYGETRKGEFYIKGKNGSRIVISKEAVDGIYKAMKSHYAYNDYLKGGTE